MTLIYNFGIRAYCFLAMLMSRFNKKADLWVKGQRNSIKSIKKHITENDEYVWFHCSSLGEFEQGRPVIEQYKKTFPKDKIALSFFSPSGYEIRKNYPLADLVFYLPLDTRKNAKTLISLLKPKKVFFVKYEFWHHYLKELSDKQIPTYLFSAIFRPNQIFFKWYGTWFKKILTRFDLIFVQNKASLDLLKAHKLNKVELSGDTRFDRVAEIASKPKSMPLVKTFVDNKFCIVCGSTWPKDEALIFEFIEKNKHANIKYILAPHEVNEEHLNQIKTHQTEDMIRYSELNQENATKAKVLLIDTIGLLSSLYQFGQLAYIGGGFGAGIHNTLEAATFGMPIVFGPNYQKFLEAKELIKLGAAKAIENAETLHKTINFYYQDEEKQIESSQLSKNYVLQHSGISKKIIESID